MWSRHVGDPILESNITRRIDFALFMVDTLENDELAHPDRQSPEPFSSRSRRGLSGEIGSRNPSRDLTSERFAHRFRDLSTRSRGPLDFCFPAECASRSSREAAGNRMTASSLSAGMPTRADQFAGPSARCSGVQSGSRACGQAKTSMRIPSGSKTKNA